MRTHPRKMILALAILCAAAMGRAADEPAAPAAAVQAPAQATAAAPAGAAAPAPAPADVVVPLLGVDRAVLTADGVMLEVHFSLPPSNISRLMTFDNQHNHVIDEADGKTYYVVKLGALGPLGQKRIAKGSGKGYYMIDNRMKTLKAGATVTVVVAGLKKEHVTVTQ
jgi:hypothetical protein